MRRRRALRRPVRVTSGSVRKYGAYPGECPGRRCPRRPPLAYWWYVCGGRRPAAAGGGRPEASDLRMRVLGALADELPPEALEELLDLGVALGGRIGDQVAQQLAPGGHELVREGDARRGQLA